VNAFRAPVNTWIVVGQTPQWSSRARTPRYIAYEGVATRSEYKAWLLVASPMIYWCLVSMIDMKERSHCSLSEPSWAKAVRVASLDRPPSARARSTPARTGSMPALRKYLLEPVSRSATKCTMSHRASVCATLYRDCSGVLVEFPLPFSFGEVGVSDRRWCPCEIARWRRHRACCGWNHYLDRQDQYCATVLGPPLVWWP